MEESKKEEIIIPLNGEDPLLSGLRITKVVCSRTVKTSLGDTYSGFSASVDPPQGLSLKQARVAALRIGLEVDRLAFQRAIIGRLVAADQAEAIATEIVHDYLVAIREETTQKKPEPKGIEVSNE